MKNKDLKQSLLSPLMVEDATAERTKKRLGDAGLIVNAGAGKTPKPPVERNEGPKR